MPSLQYRQHVENPDIQRLRELTNEAKEHDRNGRLDDSRKTWKAAHELKRKLKSEGFQMGAIRHIVSGRALAPSKRETKAR